MLTLQSPLLDAKLRILNLKKNRNLDKTNKNANLLISLHIPLMTCILKKSVWIKTSAYVTKYENTVFIIYTIKKNKSERNLDIVLSLLHHRWTHSSNQGVGLASRFPAYTSIKSQSNVHRGKAPERKPTNRLRHGTPTAQGPR